MFARFSTQSRPQRIQILARLASSRLARHARLCHDGCPPTSRKQADAQKNQVERNAKTSDLIPWSIQEIRRIAQSLARKRIQPADVIAWSPGGALIRPQHRNLISNKNHNCNANITVVIVFSLGSRAAHSQRGAGDRGEYRKATGHPALSLARQPLAATVMSPAEKTAR